MTAHRYWRMVFPTNGGGGAVSLTGIEYHSTPGGSQICTGGTASASSIFSGTYPASAPLSGSLWSSSGGVPQWWQYDFGSGNSATVVEVKLTQSGTLNQAPLSMIMQYSDNGTTFTTAWLCTALSAWTTSGQVQTLTQSAAAGSVRYWGICADSSVSNSNLLIGDMSWRGVAGGPSINPVNILTASSVFNNTVEPEQVVEPWVGEWASSGGVPQSWTVQFVTTPVAITEVILGSSGSYSSQSPSAFSLQYSSNGSSWTTLQSFTPATWTAALQHQTFEVTNTPVSANYWRVNITTANGGSDPSLSYISMATSTGGINLLNGVSVTYKGTNGLGEYQVIDGSAAAYYQSGANAYPLWWLQDMKQPIWPVQLAITAAASGTAGNQPGYFAIICSSDGINFTSIGSQTAGTWSTSQVQVFLAQNPPALGGFWF